MRPKDLDTLFGQLEQLVTFNTGFHAELVKPLRRVRRVRSACSTPRACLCPRACTHACACPQAERLQGWEGRPDSERVLGDVFVAWLPIFKIYTTYHAQFEASSELLTRLREHNPRFQAFLDQCPLQHPVFSILITPIQRVPRYEVWSPS